MKLSGQIWNSSSGRNRTKTGAKKKNLLSRFDRYKSAKIGHNKTIKDTYKLDTV